jgi:UDP-N-acetyl-D-mannosaminuronic acid transferase (WecB/TagA/CpsF family)
LDYAKKKYQTYGLILYGSTPAQIKHTQDFLEKQWHHIIYAQDGYRPFDRDAYDHAARPYSQYKKILIVGRSSISHAIQEERRYTERHKCHERGLCVCLQGGIFEHSSMGGQEKRAPLIIQRLKAERIRRRFINPQKNTKKVRYSVKVFVDWFLTRLTHE